MKERFEEGESRFQREMYITRKNIILDDDSKYISHKLLDKIIELLKRGKKVKK